MSIYLIPTDTCYGIACPISEPKDYEKIYKIKTRSFEKPLAIMVSDFHWLAENTDLTEEQIEYLYAYEKPFTILTQSPRIKMILEFDDEEFEYRNKDIYTKFAFRVAHTPEQKKLIKEVGPIFLTSANLSNKPEIYKVKDLEKEFKYYLDKKEILCIGKKDLKDKNPPSEIFEFQGETLEKTYFRK